MDNGMNFWLGFLIIITSCLTQELTTAEYLTRNIRNEEATTTDTTIFNSSSISHFEELFDLNQINNNDTQTNNGSDYVNDNFIEDQIALESNDKSYNRGSVKYNILPSPLTTDASPLSSNISPKVDLVTSNSTLNPDIATTSTKENDKENKNSSPNRSEYSRSYEKYTSPEFQSINNVYKYEVSPEILRYTSSELFDEISSETKSNAKSSESNIFTSELTTPTTLLFDDRHYNIQREIINNIKENDDLTTSIPNIIEIIKPRVNKTIKFNNIENIEQFDSINAASRHSKLIIENNTSLNIESQYLTNKTTIETTLSPKVNELDYLTVSPIKNRARFSIKTIENEQQKTTTPQTITSRARFSVKPIESDESNEKNTIIKKPKWKPHYLSTQTPTNINPVYENLQKNTTNITKRGSIKYTDTLGTTTNSPETTTISDSIVQENQQHAVRILPPEENVFDIFSTTEDSISTTKIDNIETTTSESLFDVEILDSSTNDSVTTDSNSFTVEIELTTENPSTTVESTTKFTNRISLLESISTTPINYEFSTEFDLSTTTERILITTVNDSNNETIVTTNIPSNDDVTTEATSTETSTFLPESSTVTTNIIPITLSALESNISTTTVENSYVIKNKSLSHEDDNLSFINQQSSENTIKPGKSNYLTPTSEEDDIKVKLPFESSTTAQTIVHSSSILTTINYKTIDDNTLPETINKKSKPTTTTSSPTPLSSSTISHIFETTTFGYDYKYGHKTSENNVYKHFSTADENNIHTNAPDGRTTSTTTSTTTESLENTMEPIEEEEETNPITIIAIIIITIAAICLVLLALLLIIMRKRQKRFNYGQRCTPVSLDAYSLDSVSVYNSVRRKGAIRASKRSYGNPAFEDTENISHPMNFSKLANFAHNDEGIAKEYDDIPVITAQASEVPLGCESKNRYANVIPLPETRVYLTKIEGDINSDYINANFIRGPKNSKAFYIATQAPLENTIDDFWRMIWEQQSKLVIQVTDLYENGVEKCFDYLPPSEVLDCHRQFGDFQITLKKREVKEKYIIHSIQLKNMVSNSWREITHLWYLGWPERGVPSEVDSLIAFLIEARSYTKSNTNSTTDNEDDKIKESANGYLSTGEPIMGPTPIVVHCSPGTGRTGTIISCDILMREFELTRIIDVPKIVYRIRRDRAGAVQTKDQYAYIYKVINVYATKLTGGALDSI